MCWSVNKTSDDGCIFIVRAPGAASVTHGHSWHRCPGTRRPTREGPRRGERKRETVSVCVCVCVCECVWMYASVDKTCSGVMYVCVCVCVCVCVTPMPERWAVLVRNADECHDDTSVLMLIHLFILQI